MNGPPLKTEGPAPWQALALIINGDHCDAIESDHTSPCPEIKRALDAYDRAPTRRHALHCLALLVMLKCAFECGRKAGAGK